MPKNHYQNIEDWHRDFIEEQQMFFVATAALEGRVNLAPKDSASLKVMGPHRIVWLNLTGAENETGAHLGLSPRMTLMWCSFTKRPMILRAYGNATLIHRRDGAWSELIELFEARPGARQIIDVKVDLVLKSCGFGVPLYDFVGERDTLRRWEETQGPEGVHQHWRERNLISIDGTPTHLLSDNE
jgi:hypothetical protein